MVQKRVIFKANCRHRSTIIFLHGLGDNGYIWAQLLNRIRPPCMKIICPTANTIPVTLLGNAKVPAWFNINILDIDGPEDEDGIEYSKNYIHKLINNEIYKGIPSENIILGGFSQGGALAIYSALTFNKPLCGLIILSCWLPLHNKFNDYITAPENLPIFQGHGDSDPICPYQIGLLTHIILKNYSRNSTFIKYNSLGHGVSQEELLDIKKFIDQHIQCDKLKFWWCFGKTNSNSYKVN